MAGCVDVGLRGKVKVKSLAMSPTEYQSWMQRAFLAVEGTLALEFLTPSRLCITEELLRTALVRGLAAAEPAHAHRIRTEETVAWSDDPSWAGGGERPGRGRRIQHDVYIAPENGDRGLACEVKWLKNEQGKELIKDIWKLALSRSTQPERRYSLRTFLLVGGERDAISDSINALYNHRPRLADLPRYRTGQNLPQPKEISLNRWLGTEKGAKGLSELLKWGNPAIYRTPPATRDKLLVYTRATWLRPRDVVLSLPTGGTLTWNAVLWELNAEGCNAAPAIDWSRWKDAIMSA